MASSKTLPKPQETLTLCLLLMESEQQFATRQRQRAWFNELRHHRQVLYDLKKRVETSQNLDTYANVAYNTCMNEHKLFYTLKELAEAAKVSTAYLRQLIAQGKLQAEKLGDIWTVTAAEAKRFLAGRQ